MGVGSILPLHHVTIYRAPGLLRTLWQYGEEIERNEYLTPAQSNEGLTPLPTHPPTRVKENEPLS